MDNIMELTSEKYRASSSEVKGVRRTQSSFVDKLIPIEQDIGESLSKVVRLMLEGQMINAVKQMKSQLSKITPQQTKLLTTWRDSRGLDLLHNSIVANCPEMVELLTGETAIFPPPYKPPSTPYAHLAALLGHTNCLRIVLQYRPADFFKITQPHHAMKLPPEVKRKFKLDDPIRGGAGRNIDNLLEKVKQRTQESEASIEKAKGDKKKDDDFRDIADAFQEELKSLDETSKGKKRRGHVPTKAQRTSLSDELDISPGDKKAATGSSMTDDLLLKRAEVIKRLHRQPLKPPSMPKITVYCDVFSHGPTGVVNGAGMPVDVTFTDMAKQCGHIKDMRDLPETRASRSTVLPALQKRGSVPDQDMVLKFRGRDSKVFNVPPSQPTIKPMMEVGVRGKKRYKEFQVKLEPHQLTVKEDSHKYHNKTPLILAAERGHLDCVTLILDDVIQKNNPMMVSNEPLTLATKARCSEAIMLLMDKKISRMDYQSAVLMAIREMYPDCLTVLLGPAEKIKERPSLFDGINLFHVLYTQSLMANCRYEMMPVMTRVLIHSREDVNAHNVPRTFPMYTLINCAFNVHIGKQILCFVECLKILLMAKANPHFNEEKLEKAAQLGVPFTRRPFPDAVKCVLESARKSPHILEHRYWSRILIKKIIITIEKYDRTNNYNVCKNVLFDYMDSVSELGLDHTIVRSLLRYGGNPDFWDEARDRYAINAYFDNVIPYLARFEMISSYCTYQKEIEGLMLIARGMSYKCLKSAQLIFLDQHLLEASLQALPLCRYFGYLLNEMLRSPRTLVDLTSLFIWELMKRNTKKIESLPVPLDIQALIIP